MRRTTVHLDLEMDEAAMRDSDPEIRRLRHDRGVGSDARRDRLGPDARELLVGDGREDHVPAQRALRAAAVASMHAARLPFMSCAPRP